jgi:hypothetical protein
MLATQIDEARQAHERDRELLAMAREGLRDCEEYLAAEDMPSLLATVRRVLAALGPEA